MSAISVPAAASILSLLLAATALPAQTNASANPSTSVASAAGMSKVRIVRISEVRGAVQMNRGTGFEAAIQNLPVVEASQVQTGQGVAEIEFEDNSTLRLGADTTVEFPLLERHASGATLTAVRVVRGMAYVSLEKGSAVGNDFTLQFGPEKLPLSAGSHVRLEMNATGASLAVLGGAVEVNGADAPVAVPSKRTITFAFAPDAQPEIAKGIVSNSLDSWDKQSAEYHERVANISAFGNAPYAYGVNDMSYYGSFMDASDCGMMWRPFFASAAWDPYSNGAWAWYPGTGYSWVSPYPWGWMPYHYGSWSYCPSAGWGWMPGGAWNGLSNMTASTGRTFGNINIRPGPRQPSGPPKPGESTLVGVNLNQLVFSQVNKGSFVFRRDSAGLGIPREGLGGLSGFSHDALRRGTTSTPVYLTAGSETRTFGGPGRTTNQGFAPAAIHRGSAPAASFSSNAGFNSPGFSAPGQSVGQSTLSSGNSSHAGGVAPVGGAPAGGGGGGHPH